MLCRRLHTRAGNFVTSGTPGINAPHCRFDTPAPAISRAPRVDNARLPCNGGGNDSSGAAGVSASGTPTISSGALSATNVPRPVAELT